MRWSVVAALAVWLRRALLLPSFVILTACAGVSAPRPGTLLLTASEIERQLVTDLGSALELFKGLDLRRPEVAMMPVAERLQLSWTVRLDEVSGPSSGALPIGVAVALSGKPRLNGAGTAIDLTQVTIDDVRITGVPRLFGFGLAQLADKKGATLPDLPLIDLPAERLLRDKVAYAATGVDVSYDGLRVAISPK
jgi:hypothetical protein